MSYPPRSSHERHVSIIYCAKLRKHDAEVGGLYCGDDNIKIHENPSIFLTFTEGRHSRIFVPMIFHQLRELGCMPAKNKSNVLSLLLFTDSCSLLVVRFKCNIMWYVKIVVIVESVYIYKPLGLA
jgi:hypothetical protein